MFKGSEAVRKHMIIITPFITILFLILQHYHVLTGGYGSVYFIIPAIAIVSLILSFMERNAEKNADACRVHYENLDVMRFLFAIVVLLLHMRPFLGYNDRLDLTVNYIIGRICVPLFFITTGYFCAIKEQQHPGYILTYIKKTIPLYLLWSLLYLPFGLDALKGLQIEVTPAMIPFAVLVGIFYSGVYYHLWYFPALLFALLILAIWKRFFKLKYLLVFSLLLLCIGASESYFGILPIPVQNFLNTYYFKIFYTTRNFLFFGLFYVVLGYYVGKKKETFVPYSFLKFLFCCFLLVIEALLLQTVDRLDSNIMLSCIPLTYYLFITLLHVSPIIKYQPKIPYRSYYKYYYLLHPAVIFFITPLFEHYQRMEGHYFIQIFLVIGCVQILTMMIVWMKKKYPKALRWL